LFLFYQVENPEQSFGEKTKEKEEWETVFLQFYLFFLIGKVKKIITSEIFYFTGKVT
jgi:hypothetical protein